MRELAYPHCDGQDTPIGIHGPFLRSRYEPKEFLVIRFVGDHGSAEVVEVIVMFLLFQMPLIPLTHFFARYGALEHIYRNLLDVSALVLGAGYPERRPPNERNTVHNSPSGH